MARVELSEEVGDDLDRIFDHLMKHDVPDAPARIKDIMLAIEILERNPLIGRPVDSEMRELVIGRDARGYVARYRYIAQLETVFVLAIRSQKEAGHS